MSDLQFGEEKWMQSRNTPDLARWSVLTSAEQRVLGTLFTNMRVKRSRSLLLPSDAWAKEGLSGAEAKLAFAMLRRKQWIKSEYKSWESAPFISPNVIWQR